MHLLLCNDDGIEAEGLNLLRQCLLEAMPECKLTTVAPASEQSGASHSLTLNQPMLLKELGDRRYSVGGTPTDCVLVALHGLLKEDPPDVILSGINHGPNMGEDTHYSGTVAAAFEGMLLGLPSLALSLAERRRPYDFSGCRHFVTQILPGWLRTDLSGQHLLNVNIPSLPPEEIQGIRLCKLGSREYHDILLKTRSASGEIFYTIGASGCTYEEDGNGDFVLSQKGHITVTPLHVDTTDYKMLAELEGLERSWLA